MTTASEFSGGRLYVSIKTSELPEAERTAVLNQAFDYAVGRGLFDELELDTRSFNNRTEAEKLALSRLSAKAHDSRRTNMRIRNPTAGEVWAAVEIARHLISINLNYRGELVAGTSDEVSDVDFVAGSADDLDQILNDLQSRVSSPLRVDTAELESPPYFLVVSEAEILETFKLTKAGNSDVKSPPIDDDRFMVEAFDKEGQAAGSMEIPELEEGAFRLYDGDARLASLIRDGWDVKVSGWSEPRRDELKVYVEAFLGQIGAAAIESEVWETYTRRAAEVITLWHHHHTPKLIRWISALVRRAPKSRTPG